MVPRNTYFLLLFLVFIPARGMCDPLPEVKQILCAATVRGMQEFQKLLPTLDAIREIEDPEEIRRFITIGEQWAENQGRARLHFSDPNCCVGFLAADARVCGCCPLKDIDFFKSDLLCDVMTRLKALRKRLEEVELPS